MDKIKVIELSWWFQMLSLEEGWKWPALALFLFLLTFGSVGLLSLGYVICILIGWVLMIITSSVTWLNECHQTWKFKHRHNLMCIKGGDSHDGTLMTLIQKHYVTRLTADVWVFNIYTSIDQSIHLGSLYIAPIVLKVKQ